MVTGNLKPTTDSRILTIVFKGSKPCFPSHTDFNKRCEEIAGALQEFCNRWCKREHVKFNALKYLENKYF